MDTGYGAFVGVDIEVTNRVMNKLASLVVTTLEPWKDSSITVAGSSSRSIAIVG